MFFGRSRKRSRAYSSAAPQEKTERASSALSCGVEREAIIKDYTVSREYNRERLERYLADHPEVDRKIVLANETSMAQFLDMFFDQYGNMESYYLKAGLTPGHLARIRRKLLESGPND